MAQKFIIKKSMNNNLLKIIKETNEQEYEYDLSLSKKFSLNEDNIDFTRHGNINDVKFGRLITNEKDFYVTDSTGRLLRRCYG